jgi:RimJ/RimL family protein N-acetyltransferase
MVMFAMKKETMTLRDGKRVELRGLRANENIRMLCNFINAFTRERAYLTRNKLISLKKEREWLKKTLKDERRGNEIYLGAFYKGRLVGSCEGHRGSEAMRRNVEMGITVAKEFRGVGLGKLLLKRVINLVKRKLKPRIIYLYYLEDNKPALALYEKMGFREVARLPKWVDHYGKLQDDVIMVLKK